MPVAPTDHGESRDGAEADEHLPDSPPAGSGPCSLFRGGRPSVPPLGARRLSGCWRAAGRGALPCGRPGLTREGPARRRAPPFTPQRSLDRTGAPGRGFPLACALARAVGALGAPPGLGEGGAFLRRAQFHAGPAALRQPDGYRLLGRARTVLPFANVVYLFAHELAGLGGRGLALPGVSPGPVLASSSLAWSPPAPTLGGAWDSPVTPVAGS
jgi:hypothetical protein